MNPPQPASRFFRMRLTAISLSLLVGIVLLLLKFYVYHLTRSSAVLSDALESILNVVASSFALISIIMSSRPADERHPYGHGKIEYFSAGFEGALIVLAAVGIFLYAWTHIKAPHPLPNLASGLWLLTGTALINLLTGIFLVRVGHRTRSLALVADGRHLLTDVYTTCGVLLGLLVVQQTGWYQLDGIIAALVGLVILVSGLKLVRRSFAGLMDASDDELLHTVSELLNQHRKPLWIDIHQLRVRTAGAVVHVDFHLILPYYLPLEDAHANAQLAENIIQTHFEGLAEVLVHLDPCADHECAICRLNLCQERNLLQQCSVVWQQKTLTAPRQERGVRATPMGGN